MRKVFKIKQLNRIRFKHKICLLRVCKSAKGLNSKQWITDFKQCALVGYFRSQKPSRWLCGQKKNGRFVGSRVWYETIKGKIHISPLHQEMLSFVFDSLREWYAVLKSGPWMFEPSELVLLQWQTNSAPRFARRNKLFLSTITFTNALLEPKCT